MVGILPWLTHLSREAWRLILDPPQNKVSGRAAHTLLMGDVRFASTLEAQVAGISIIHQELNLAPHLSAAGNIFPAREPTRGLFIDRTKLKADTLRLFRYLSVDIDPYAVVRTLSVAQCQMVEIAKALSVETEVLIMYEPTSSLMEPEAQALFKVIHELKRSGVGIVYISHRLDEMAEIADRVTVFRDGHYTPNKTSISKPLKMCSTDLRSASAIPINV